MSEEEKTSEQMSEEEGMEGSSTAVTRRQFLIGAGAGLVVGAAGAAGVVTLVSPSKPAETLTAKSATDSQPAGQAVSNFPASVRQVSLNIDGKNYDLVVDVRTSLWEAMTYHLGMASSNVGCDRAQCGACAVVVDGRAVNGCTVLAARLGRGQKIITVAGIGKGTRTEDLHPVANAYWQQGGFQCGICTRGFIMSSYALLQKNPSPNEAEVQEALAGNICRCGEYAKIYDSVFRAAADMRKKA